MLETILQVCHLLPQSLDACVNGIINSRLNLLHKEGLGNLTEVIQNELYSKAHANKFLNYSLPLQDPLGGDSVNKVVLNVIHHTPQQLQKVLSGRTTEAESLHKVTMAIVDRHQMRSTILKNFEAVEVYIGRPRTPKFCRIKVINLRLIKKSKEGCGLTHRVRNCGRTVAHLKLRRGSGRWTYQENMKHGVRNHELRRTNSQ